MSAPKDWSGEENKRFVNALREFLGLQPLYGLAESSPWWSAFIGDGTRRVSTGRSKL